MSREEEIFDVVDENDNVIGKATRAECHSNPNLIHHTVQFAIFSKGSNKLLVERRSTRADAAPNQLAFFGEHVKSGETYEAALRRGLKEEVGIDSYTAEFLKETHFIYDHQHEIVRFYLVTVPNQEIKTKKEVLSNRVWLTLDEICERVNDFADHTKYWIRNVSRFQSRKVN